MEVERVLPATILHCTIELHGIAANRTESEAHYVVSPGFDDIRSEGAPQHVQGLAQGRPRTRLVELWPEHGQKRVAAVRAARRGDGEIGEESETTRLAGCCERLTPSGRGQAPRPVRA